MSHPGESISLKPGFVLGGLLERTIPTGVGVSTGRAWVPSSEDERWMREAFLASMEGVGITHPNPAVGCVLVKEGRLLARGSTEAYRQRHAEQPQ